METYLIYLPTLSLLHETFRPLVLIKPSVTPISTAFLVTLFHCIKSAGILWFDISSALVGI
jgi:hypothetical protein